MYSAAAKYSVGDKIRHSTFGEGLGGHPKPASEGHLKTGQS
jgi:hypothetical protein